MDVNKSGTLREVGSKRGPRKWGGIIGRWTFTWDKEREEWVKHKIAREN